MKQIRYNYTTIIFKDEHKGIGDYEVKLNKKSYNFKTLRQAKSFIDSITKE